MMSKELRTVIQFCLDMAPLVPLARQVELYRGLAEICGSKVESDIFLRLAKDLAAAESRAREAAFRFTQSGDGQ